MQTIYEVRVIEPLLKDQDSRLRFNTQQDAIAFVHRHWAAYGEIHGDVSYELTTTTVSVEKVRPIFDMEHGKGVELVNEHGDVDFDFLKIESV